MGWLSRRARPGGCGSGAGEYGASRRNPSNRLAARLDRTLELYEADIFPRIIVSGALGKEGHDEARVMREYLIAKGVPAEVIAVDSGGFTTGASAANARDWMRGEGVDRVLVVTQYFHVPRSKLALRKAGDPVVLSAHARHFEWRDLYSIPRELVGYASYRFR